MYPRNKPNFKENNTIIHEDRSTNCLIQMTMLMPLTCEKCLGEKQNANNAIWKIK